MGVALGVWVFDQQGNALAAAHTRTGNAISFATARQFTRQGDGETNTRCGQWMTQSNRAAVDVEQAHVLSLIHI